MNVRPSDKNLVAACCEQNRHAQKQLYELFAGKLLVVALRYVKNRADAEDILQESFIKVFKNIASFRFDSPLEVWLKRIVANTALKYLQTEPNWHLHTDTEPAVDIANSEYSLANYHFTELLNIIQELPTGCRAVFNLFAVEGYQHQEIAEMLQISEGTSKSQYARARQLLRDKLEKENRVARG